MKLRILTSLYSSFRALFIDPDEPQDSSAAVDRIAKPLFRALLVAAGCIVVVLAIDLRYGLVEGSNLGPFGDFFGGVLNPVFTFLTVFGLVITIVIQRTELRLAREEYAKTSAALTTQAVESTFFSSVQLHHKIVDGLRFEPDSLPESDLDLLRRQGGIQRQEQPPVSGRMVFDAVALQIRNRSRTPQGVHAFYRVVQTEHNHILGHYFRNLYQALKLIDGYSAIDMPEEQKRKYASILRAQLSSSELALLYLNCSGDTVDDGQFRQLLVRYRMLEHLPLKLSDGVYLAGRTSLAVADEVSICEYLESDEGRAEQSPYRGAFGRNPVRLPGDA